MSRHLQLTGLDIHEPNNILVENGTGVSISALKVVSLDGFGTVRPKIKVVSNPLTDRAFGITISSISSTSPNNLGYISSLGFLYNVNTNAFNAGDILYSDSNGDLTTVALGNAIAYVTKKDAVNGILFVVGLSAFIDPESNAWNTNGNLGTIESVNFIGTKDAQGLRIKTNNTLAALFDTAGKLALGPDLIAPQSHVHQKSHLAYSGSGLQQETFALNVTSSTAQTAFVVPIADLSIVRIEFTAIARQADGTQRAMLKRTGLFYRESSNVQIEDKWISDQTIRSSPNFNISYVMGTNTLTLKVKSATAGLTYWTGNVKIEALSIDT